MINITIQKRHLYGFAALIVAFAVIIPTASWASHTFKDVPEDNTFHGDIDWLASTGITRGCNPPVNDEFCPEDPVTRQTLAAFLKRLAEGRIVAAATAESATTADTAKSADTATSADTAKSADTAASADHADTAGDADTVDGLDASAFAPSNLIGTSVMAISVAADGSVVSSATEGPVSVVKGATGSYTVTFDRPVNHCIAATNEVLFISDYVVSADVAISDILYEKPEDVLVVVTTTGDSIPTNVDAAWSMILVCPDIAHLMGTPSQSPNVP